MPIRALLAALVLALPLPAAAQQFGFGVGYADLRDRGGALTLNAEYRTSPLGAVLGSPLRLGAGGEIDTRGDWYAGIGPALTVPMAGGFQFDGSLMPGLVGGDGTAFALRTRIGFSAPIGGGWRGGLHLTHRSNVEDSVALGFTVTTLGF